MNAIGQVRAIANERQRRAAHPETSVWVGASAGSGKTKVLTDRVLNLLLDGAPPHRILCLTFTKAAAAEMNNRINARLGQWAAATDPELTERLEALGRTPDAAELVRARRLFAEVLEAPGGMRILTIHAFCQSVLARFPLEAGIAPHFEVMAERDAAELLEAARNEMLARARAESDPALAQALAEVTGRVHEVTFPELIGELAYERGRIAELRDRHGGIDGLIGATYAALGIDESVTPDTVVAAASSEGAYDELALRRALEGVRQGTGKKDARAARNLARWLDDPTWRIAAFDRYLEVFVTKDRQPRQSLCTKSVAVIEPRAPEILAAEQRRLLEVLEQRNKATVAVSTAALLRLADTLIEIYTRRKASRALLDYDDLVLHTRDLLGRPGIAAWVLFKLDGGLDHILIDEAQDTNPDQWRIVASLAEEFFAGIGTRDTPRTLFAVGDIKQSIFSFQRADPAAFDAMRAHFRARVEAAQAAWDDVALDVSFRSTAPVLHAIDAVFAMAPARDGVVAQGQALQHLADRQEAAGLVEIWPLLTPRSPPPPEPWKPPVERVSSDSPRARLAGLLARRIRRWLGDEEYLPARARPIRPGDIMVLVRRRGAFVEELVRALKDMSVPVAGVDRMVLTEQLAVMDLMALGAFLLLPEDDLTLATLLKGPLVGLSEEELFALAHAREGSLWQALRRHAGSDTPAGKAYDYLADLLRRVDFVRPYELYAGLLAAGGQQRLLARLGPEAEDPIFEFLSLALSYERTNTPSLQGFLHWLSAGATEVKRDLEQGGDTVRVLTVHGAKGLQAPVVILPDTTQMPDKPPRLLWPAEHDVMLWVPYRADSDAVADRAYRAARAAQDDEYRRLLYVAMSRAEDRLYVCGWQAGRAPSAGCWYDLVHAALTDIATQVEDSFLQTEVADIEPTVWRLIHTQRSRVPQAEAAAASGPPTPLPAWARALAPAEPAPPRPLTPSRPDGDEPTVRPPLAPGASPYRRGALIHRLLQLLPELPAGERRAACDRVLGQSEYGLAPEARGAIVQEVLAVVEQPDFAALFGPGSRAEVPLAGVIAQGSVEARVVSGQVDRLVVTDSAVLVVDYKTNRPPAARAEEAPRIYLRQMAAYRTLLQGIYPGREIRCALLWTDGPTLMPLPQAVLDDHAGPSPSGEGAPGAA